MSFIFFVLGLFFSVYVIFILAVVFYMQLFSCSYEFAKEHIKGLLEDLIYSRSSIALERTDFPSAFLNDIQAYLKTEEFEDWFRRFKLKSQLMEEAGYNSGLPYYAVKLYVPTEDYKESYETFVNTLVANILSLNHCYPTVLLNWHNKDGEYEWLEIRYSRTQKEKESLVNTIIHSDQDKLHNSTGIARDIALDHELDEVE